MLRISFLASIEGRQRIERVFYSCTGISGDLVDVFPSHTLPTLPYPVIHPSLLTYGAQCRTGIQLSYHTSQELYRAAGDAMFHEKISGCVLYHTVHKVMAGGGCITAQTEDGVCPRDFFSFLFFSVFGMICGWKWGKRGFVCGRPLLLLGSSRRSPPPRKLRSVYLGLE